MKLWWITKGVLLGSVVFIPLWIGYLYLAIRPHGAAVGLALIKAVTIYSPLFWMLWVVLVLCGLDVTYR